MGAMAMATLRYHHDMPYHHDLYGDGHGNTVKTENKDEYGIGYFFCMSDPESDDDGSGNASPSSSNAGSGTI